MLNDSCMVLFCLRGPFEASLYEITFGRRLVREEKETRLMWVYCATYKHDLFFSSLMWGGGASSWTSTSFRFIKTRKELHLNGKRFRGYQQKRKWRMGEKKWEIEHWNFFILFCFRFTVYNEEHIFSSIFTFAFKNNQLNSRNEKID